jgi:hypothetical protein
MSTEMILEFSVFERFRISQSLDIGFYGSLMLLICFGQTCYTCHKLGKWGAFVTSGIGDATAAFWGNDNEIPLRRMKGLDFTNTMTRTQQ